HEEVPAAIKKMFHDDRAIITEGE
ncbi:MAG: hypothetical protein PWP53_1126, partial [Lacrimispora sp.]|nr:hypothetical protein [Lacrimispora sp.]